MEFDDVVNCVFEKQVFDACEVGFDDCRLFEEAAVLFGGIA